jgi:hypothetical protein
MTAPLKKDFMRLFLTMTNRVILDSDANMRLDFFGYNSCQAFYGVINIAREAF